MLYDLSEIELLIYFIVERVKHIAYSFGTIWNILNVV